MEEHKEAPQHQEQGAPRAAHPREVLRVETDQNDPRARGTSVRRDLQELYSSDEEDRAAIAAAAARDEELSDSEEGEPPPPPVLESGVDAAASGDADDQRLPAVSTSSGGAEKQYRVQKANRFGLRTNRLLVVDDQHRALRFMTPKGRTKSEFPFSTIEDIRNEGAGQSWDTRKIVIVFRRQRSYSITFDNPTEATDFIERSAQLLSVKEAESTRARPNASISRSTPQGGPSVHMDESTASRATSLLVPGDLQAAGTRASVTSLDSEPGGTLRGYGRWSADSSAGAAASSAASVSALTSTESSELHPLEYLDYHVKKRNKFGLSQERIFVLNGVRRTLLILNKDRKFRKEIPLRSILQVDVIPGSKSSSEGSAHVYILFVSDDDKAQRPFDATFSDVFDRIHFCDSLSSMAPHVQIRDESVDGKGLSPASPRTSMYRFVIHKVVRTGMRKKRILYVDATNKIIRSLDVKKAAKDWDVGKGNLQRIYRSHEDRLGLFMNFSDRGDWHFIFAEPAARERFMYLCRSIMYDVEDSKRAEHELGQDALVNLFVGSWNVGESDFNPTYIGNWITPNKYDIYVIGLQECQKHKEWVHELKCHINQTKSSKPSEQPYVTIMEHKMWNIVLLVLIRRRLQWKIANLEVANIACGVGDVLANKGAVAVCFEYEDTSLCFICSHLAARAERLLERRNNYSKIVRGLRLGCKDVDVLHQFHHVVWFGDLNYRIDKEYSEVVKLVNEQNWEKLWESDQLLTEVGNGNAFVGFVEGPLAFPPTYRWERNTHEFSTKRFQAPSYTDRVLVRSMPNVTNMRLENYRSSPDVFGSDHRPVRATFSFLPQSSYLLGKPDPPGSQHVRIVFAELNLQPVTAPESGHQLALQISAPFSARGTDTRLVTFSPDQNSWMWPGERKLLPFVHDPEVLKLYYVLFVASSFVDSAILEADPWGCGILSMSTSAGSHGREEAASFRIPIESDGLIVGHLHGTCYISASHADNVDADMPVNSESQSPTHAAAAASAVPSVGGTEM